ncbi:MAG: NRDE family protein [Saprospiraceae bacterium]|jgi:hypothetical protein
MCTVTFIPGGGGGFILSSSRDEFPDRKISGIVCREAKNGPIVFPQDSWEGGTWIAADARGFVLCLLNGAFDRHERIPPYRKSRGIMLLELMAADAIPEYFRAYNLAGIEPFTLIMAGKTVLWEFRWDGRRRYLRPCDPGTKQIWSSPTLYCEQARKRREAWFADWLGDGPEYSREAALDFHCGAGGGDTHDGLVIDRSGLVRTVSITQVVARHGASCLYYFDLCAGAPRLIEEVPIGPRK